VASVILVLRLERERGEQRDKERASERKREREEERERNAGGAASDGVCGALPGAA
jgi:hypothetical protein